MTWTTYRGRDRHTTSGLGPCIAVWHGGEVVSGFIEDPLQRINQLGNDLRDRYQSGWPILKEVIQNADDAEARSLDLGLAPSLADTRHPLLRGPALFLVNNGRFTPKDDRGIRSYGLSGKLADRRAIGRFGLGMKSLFHLCEAFFYLGHDGRQSVARILNPWASSQRDVDGLHADWDQFDEEDQRAIGNWVTKRIDLRAGEGSTPFILWVPLRRRTNLTTSEGAIVPEYPGDDPSPLSFLRTPEFIEKIASLVPLLRHLEVVRCWLHEEEKPTLQLNLLDGATRLVFREDQPKTDLHGEVRIQQKDEKTVLHYVGRERYQDNERLNSISQAQSWPRYTRRTESGASETVPDKAQPHTAVVFTRNKTEKGEGSLTIRWAVFLPLDESEMEEVIHCEGEVRWGCTLHGYFFLDAGRRAIHGLNGHHPSGPVVPEEDRVREDWNRTLAREQTLPLLLPALFDFVTGIKMGNGEITDLCHALEKSRLWRDYGDPITAEAAWVQVLEERGPRWRLLEREKHLIPLPPPPASDSQRPWRVFPGLRELDGIPVALGVPHLARDSMWVEGSTWVTSLLSSIEVRSVFGNKGALDYLVETLRGHGDLVQGQPEVQGTLRDLLRRALREIGPERLRSHAKAVKELASFVAPQLLPIKRSPTKLLAKLLEPEIPVLPWPQELLPETSADPHLDIESAHALLATVADWIESPPGAHDEEAATQLARDLLGRVDVSSRREVVFYLQSRRFLRVHDTKAKRWRAASPDEIRRANGNALLFIPGVGTTETERLGLAPQLQASLAEDHVLVIRSEDAVLVLGDERRNRLRQCIGKAALETLGSTQPAMAGDRPRRGLLEHANDPGDSEAALAGLRLLLHGQRERANDQESPIWVRGYQAPQAWETLWRQISRVGEDKAIVVAEELASCLPPARWSIVGIREIRPETVVSEISAHREQISRIEPAIFSQEDTEEILAHVGDESLWRALPLHSFSHPEGGRGDAQGRDVYLDTGREVPLSLQGSVRLISKSARQEVGVRQEQWLRPFDSDNLIDLLLRTERPEQEMQLLLDLLGEVEGHLDDEVRKRLATTPWLLGRDGHAYRPEDVMVLESDRGAVARLAAERPGTYTVPSLLDERVKSHTSYRILTEHCFARDKAAFERLGLLLGEMAKYAVGAVSIGDADGLKSTAEILKALPTEARLPGWRLLAELIDRYDAEQVFTQVFPRLCAVVSFPSILAVLEWIPGLGQADPTRRSAFNAYLRLFRDLSDARKRLASLRLLDRGGHWRPASELCVGEAGVARRHLLDKDQAATLTNLIHAGEPRPQADGEHPTADSSGRWCSTEATAKELESYFDPWRGLVPEPLLGTFVLLLGAHPKVRELARSWLQPHTVDGALDMTPWKNASEDLDSLGRRRWLAGCSLRESIERFRFRIAIVDQDEVDAVFILGERIRVGLAKDFAHFITGKPYYWPRGEHYDVGIKIRRIERPEEYSEEDLARFLRASAEYLLETVYVQERPDLTALWEELGKSSQLSVHAARALVLDNLPLYLRQLRVDGDTRLRQALTEIDRTKERIAEIRSGGHGGDLQAAQKDEENATKHLQTLIEEDEDIQDTLVDAVRRKLGDYQYSPTSIPFELFQNADDATVEMEWLENHPMERGDPAFTPLSADVRRFVVHKGDDRLTFLHWGRPINWMGRDDELGRSRGYNRDLQKMLVVSSSDKAGETTGRFGLGFKSVFLVCRRPRLISGRMEVEIRGGMVPATGMEMAALRQLLAGNSPDDRRHPGTAIELAGLDSSTLLNEFQQLAGPLTAFSKAHVAIEWHDGERRDGVRWQGEPLLDLPVQVGDLRVGALGETQETTVAVRFDLGKGALLLALELDRFIPLPDSTPGIWVTAPTQEATGLGFALNGPFPLDAGRRRLGSDGEAQMAVASELGGRFSEILTTIVEATEGTGWQTVVETLRLKPDITPYRLWESLWKLLALSQKKAQGLAGRTITAFLKAGLGNVARTCRIVPSGLSGKYATLLSEGDVRYVAQGGLDSHVVAVLAEWDPFATKVLPGQVLREENHRQLRRLLDQEAVVGREIRFLNLASLSDWFPDHRVSPDDAAVWAKALRPNEEVHRGDGAERDLEELQRSLFRDARFRSAANTWARPRELLCSTPDGDREDEAKRCAFAPPERRLHPDYVDGALALFRWCRRDYQANAELLAQWVRDAEELRARQAAVAYLLHGDRGDSVAQCLREQGLDGTWMKGLEKGDAELAELSMEEVDDLLFRYLPDRQTLADLFSTEEATQPPPDRHPDPGMALRRIADWWAGEGDEQLQEYVRETYPRGEEPILAGDRFDREAWLTLFVLGSLHTMGWTKISQHKAFLEMCRVRGWWSTFSAVHPEKRADEWMGVLEDVMSNQIDEQQYNLWIQKFPEIYRLSRFLDEYQELFTGLHRWPEKGFSLAQALNPRTAAVLSGGGVSAPPIGRTLGAGVCFILRELLRRGRLPPKAHLVPLAYVPARRMCRLLSWLGCEDSDLLSDLAPGEGSKAIHAFLVQHLGTEGAHFGNAYDIPLQRLANDRGLQARVLGHSIVDDGLEDGFDEEDFDV